MLGPFSALQSHLSQFHQPKNKEHNSITWFLISDPWMQVKWTQNCESYPCAEPIFFPSKSALIPLWSIVLLCFHCVKKSQYLSRGKSEKSFAKIKHLHKVMGKQFCSLCSQWLTAQTLVPTIDHGVYYTREYVAFPLYKCFQ